MNLSLRFRAAAALFSAVISLTLLHGAGHLALPARASIGVTAGAGSSLAAVGCEVAPTNRTRCRHLCRTCQA